VAQGGAAGGQKQNSRRSNKAEAATSKQAAGVSEAALEVLLALAEECNGYGRAALKLVLERAWTPGREVSYATSLKPMLTSSYVMDAS
jgi:hypothetical protein